MQVKWTDTDPETGERRFVCAEKFAKQWTFMSKLERRGEWTAGLKPTLAIWEELLDRLRRRYQRREGVSDEDVQQVERVVKELRAKLQAQREQDEP
jgi:hypothetical protein